MFDVALMEVLHTLLQQLLFMLTPKHHHFVCPKLDELYMPIGTVII
jgi:hypothetical protein